jgi:hypothetical protein
MAASQAVSDTHTLVSRLQGLREQLAKKGTFEAAVYNLQSLCKYEFNDHVASDIRDEWLTIFQRCMILLRTRYTNPSFWQAGYNLFEQAKVRAFILPVLDAFGCNRLRCEKVLFECLLTSSCLMSDSVLSCVYMVHYTKVNVNC